MIIASLKDCAIIMVRVFHAHAQGSHRTVECGVSIVKSGDIVFLYSAVPNSDR